MDELTLDGEVYVSTKRAAKITGYAKDYIGQLCREGRVAARLVGRNWYVLEGSIRTHRFGEEAARQTQDTQISEMQSLENGQSENIEEITGEINEESLETWSPSRYTTEPAPEHLPTPSVSVVQEAVIPEIAPEISPEEALLEESNQPINLVEGRFSAKAKDSVPLSSKIVNDMQEAWQDWFIRTNEFKVSKETLLEERYDDTSASVSLISRISDTKTDEYSSESTKNEDADEDEALQESEETPIRLEKIIDPRPETQTEPYQESQNVPIRRSRTAPMPVRSKYYASRAQISQYTEAKEGRVLRERRILRKKKPSHVAQIFLLLIALAAIGVTFIGTAEGQQILGTRFSTFKPLEFIIGENTINK